MLNLWHDAHTLQVYFEAMIGLCLIVLADLANVVYELLIPSFVFGANTSVLDLHAYVSMAFYLVLDDRNIF